MASSQRESRLRRPVSRVSGRNVEMLLNESHLVNFLERGYAIANLCEAALAQDVLGILSHSLAPRFIGLITQNILKVLLVLTRSDRSSS